MEKKVKNDSNSVLVGMGLAAAAVGAYWLYGSKGAEKNRKMASSWIFKARAEVMDKIEKLKDLNKEEYSTIVDNVIRKYTKSFTNLDEAKTIAREMKEAWVHISRASEPAKRVVNRSIKKSSSNSKAKSS